MATDQEMEELANELLQQRQELVAFIEEFAHSHNIDEFSEAELDLWIERLRPVRLQIRAIDRALAGLAAKSM